MFKDNKWIKNLSKQLDYKKMLNFMFRLQK